MESSAAQENPAMKTFLSKSKEKVLSTLESYIKLGKDDPRRVNHSIKVALAITLVSFLYYDHNLYHTFKANGIWAVITVVVVFEYTAGGTISKGLNRGLASFLAGALAFGAAKLANRVGNICGTEKAEATVIGICVFTITAGATFTRFFPKIKARYDYGVMVFILTFCLVAVSEVRVGSDFLVAWERLATVLIGGATCIIISIFIYPVWAGEDLHNSVASNLEKLANYLEGFGSVYFPSSNYDMTIKTRKDKSFLQGYKSVLSSKGKEEILANFARWEPGHGKFRFFHPWEQYLKIGALVRECAALIEAINCHINSDIQVSPEFQSKIKESCKNMSVESGKALRELATAIKTMTEPSSTYIHLENSKSSVRNLKIALKDVSFKTTNPLAIVPTTSVASILVEMVKCVDEISKSVHELSELAHFKKAELTVSHEKNLFINQIFESEDNNLTITENKAVYFVNLLPWQLSNKSIPNDKT